MLLERNQLVIGLVVIAVLAVGTVFAVGATGGLFVAGEPMEAELEDAAGLKSGDFVFVGGFRAGEVTSVEIDGSLVRVGFSVTAPDLPSDSMANVILANTLGKRGLEIVPGSASSTLEAGSVIPLERTSTPVDVPELGDRATELLGETNVAALQELTTALADVTDGARDDVESLLQGVEDVSRIVSDRREELETVLDRATTLVDAAASKDEEIVAIIDDFGTVLERLVTRRADITRLLEETASTSTLTADLIEERRTQLDRVLASLSEDLAIVDDHQVDLAHTLAYLGVSLDGFSSIGVSGGSDKVDNPRWGNVFATNLGSIGVGSLLECNGALDVLFADLLGPDPRCEAVENPSVAPEPGPPREDAPPVGPELPPLELDPVLDSITRPLSNPESLGNFLRLPLDLLEGAL
ncbi:MCE family protein [Nitriliruptoraceae bacterium ZYF776]|nr:MCE family protein [Profundirhabdus halotolerans]